jgi:hypothetical protein
MVYRIHYELPDGSSDSVDINGESIEEIRAKAESEISKRNGANPWSQEIL